MDPLCKCYTVQDSQRWRHPSHHSAAGLLKRRHTQIKYFQGSLMNPGDLERAKVRGRGGSWSD